MIDEAKVRDIAQKAAQIGFTYGALGRDFVFAYKNTEYMVDKELGFCEHKIPAAECKVVGCSSNWTDPKG